MISDLAWDGKKAPVSLDTMSLPKDKGSIQLLDLQAQNEAIQVMWLKQYTNLRPSQHMWALVANVLIEESIAASNHVDKEVTINTYFQSLSPMTNNRSTLSPDIQKMLKVGKKYHPSFAGLRIPEKVKRELPAWYHIGAEDNPARFKGSSA